MQTLSISYDNPPADLLEQNYDCIWVWLEKRNSPEPLKGLILHRLDWLMRGTLSNYICDKRQSGSSQTTFFPSQGRVGAPLVALNRIQHFDWEMFFQNAQGLGLGNILVLCEDPVLGADLFSKMSCETQRAFPKVVEMGVRLHHLGEARPFKDEGVQLR